VANAANGMAVASLERNPVLLLADGFAAAERAYANHQFIDHAGLLRPVTKASAAAMEPQAATGAMTAQLLEAAITAPRGPVLLELSGATARAPAAPPPQSSLAAPHFAPDGPALDRARALLSEARYPLLVAGLEATDPVACAALRALAEALHCPVLVTYKAKGVFPDAHPLFGGVFTASHAEAALVQQADLILLAGADPVEFFAQPWRYRAPVIDLGTAPRPLHYRSPEVALYGPLAPELVELAAAARRSAWSEAGIAAAREAWAASLRNRAGGNAGLSPTAVVELAQAACRRAGAAPRISVDAGAHMFPCTSFWQAERPGDLLISNGLASMGYALPAGIGAALHDPGRGAIAFTGDGGLLMALGELATACALGVKLVVVVFNDATLSLIDIKKEQRAMPAGALGWPQVDFASVMQGCGGLGLRARDEAGYAAALDRALAHGGPALIDVLVDPGSYPEQIRALRG
jgi:acetolactate synthase-1/2/3 large subunit